MQFSIRDLWKSRSPTGRPARYYKEGRMMEICNTGGINARNARKVHRHQEGLLGGWLVSINEGGIRQIYTTGGQHKANPYYTDP